MSNADDSRSLALFCDFENVALGVAEAKYSKFDIKLVLERLLVKGSIVVKKAYCDWDRYKSFKESMHDASFEMIEIPHVRQSGKNSADIRMVVDALDLCYTKSHVDTFVIISGDSDFSPLISKLRENAKTAIGVGVRNSTSDLLISNCDEFIFYDDLVREKSGPKRSRRRSKKKVDSQGTGSGKDAKGDKVDKDEKGDKDDKDDKVQQAIDLVIETAEALANERGDQDLWGSMVKQALKRRQPQFNESYYGVSSFSALLEEAQARGQIELELDERSGGYILRKITE